MQFEWDPEKALTNRTKHDIEFADAVDALFDPLALTMIEEHAEELRYVTMGRDAMARTLVVVYTKRRGRIRLISARRATRRERARYEERS
jgi:hypothetical protein